MGTLSPTLTDTFRLLHTDLYLHPDAAESLVSKTAEWSHQDVDVARKLIPTRWRCRTHRSAWPDPIVTTIHTLVKDPDRELVADTSHAHAACPVDPRATETVAAPVCRPALG